MSDTPKEKKFMREKVVKPPVDKRRLVRRAVCVLLVAVIFGAVAAVAFVVSRPVAERFFGHEPTEPTIPITIERDTEPSPQEESTAEPPVETTEAAISPEEIHDEINEAVQEAFEEFTWTPDHIAGYQQVIRQIAEEADRGIVTVSLIRQQVDWFDNPVESAGQYAGVIVAINPSEVVILTGDRVVAEADSLGVIFSDGSTAPGELKQRDRIGKMAVLRVSTADISDSTLNRIKAFELGNSYTTRAGDPVIAVGSPSGQTHSIGQGIVSYVAKGVQVEDGLTRVLYTDLKCDEDGGTFLINLSGELIGWATDRFRTEENSGITMAASISEYKGVLQKLSNGVEVPYFGIMGQDVTEAMQSEGIPRGVYITDAIAEGPAYNAGIQNGDILTAFGGEDVISMYDFRSRLEERTSGETVTATIARQGLGEYKEIEYEVTVGAR